MHIILINCIDGHVIGMNLYWAYQTKWAYKVSLIVQKALKAVRLIDHLQRDFLFLSSQNCIFEVSKCFFFKIKNSN